MESLYAVVNTNQLEGVIDRHPESTLEDTLLNVVIILEPLLFGLSLARVSQPFIDLGIRESEAVWRRLVLREEVEH